MLTAALLLALLLFWGVGAYNRIIRLRAAVLAAFGGLDVFLLRRIALVGEYQSARAAAGSGAHRQRHDALEAATAQFGAALAVVRATPLDASAVATLAAGVQLLDQAWQGLELGQEAARTPRGKNKTKTASAAEAAHDVSRYQLWELQYQDLQAHGMVAAQQYNQSVERYNQAVEQFPANFLAWFFSFKKGQSL